MTVRYGNLPYFGFIIVFLGVFFALYFLLRNKSKRTQWIVMFSLLVLNFLLHFLSPLYLGHGFQTIYVTGSGYMNSGVNRIFLNNICAVSAVMFPFFFLSKDRFFRTGMVYIGIVSGVLAMLVPTEAIGTVSTLTGHINLWRFYIQHAIIWIVPMLMLCLKHHKLKYRELWIAPVYMIMVFTILLASNVIRQYIGSLEFAHNSNNSMQWGLDEQLGILFSWLVPNFMTIIPLGAYAGTAGYWPMLYLVPAIVFYMPLIALLITFINKKTLNKGKTVYNHHNRKYIFQRH